MAWLAWILGVFPGLLLVQERALRARARARHPAPGRLVDVGGRRLHVWAKGEGPGPTVVVEQGAGGPSVLWEPIQERVAGFARVCLYDRAGYLWSDAGPARPTLADRVEDLRRGLAGAGLPAPYVFVAHSFGGPLVRLFARTHPALVGGLVLVDTPEEAVITGEAYAGYGRMVNRFARVLQFAAHFGVVRLAVVLMLRARPDGLSQARWDAFKALLPEPAYFRAAADDPAALNREGDTLRGLGGAGSLGDLPLVVIRHAIPFPGPAAALEAGWEEGQHRLAALSSRGRLVVATHSNHMVQNDEPELVIDAIRRVVEAVRHPVGG